MHAGGWRQRLPPCPALPSMALVDQSTAFPLSADHALQCLLLADNAHGCVTGATACHKPVVCMEHHRWQERELQHFGGASSTASSKQRTIPAWLAELTSASLLLLLHTATATATAAAYWLHACAAAHGLVLRQ